MLHGDISSSNDTVGDQTSPQNAYPAFWGPFAIVGDGAARRT